MLATEFHRVFGDNEDFWGEDPDYPVSLWQHEVEEDDTRVGYWDWVLLRRQEAEDEEE